MKQLIKYWWVSKIACVYKITQVILTVIRIWVNAKVVLLLSDALADFEHIVNHVSVVAWACAFQTIIGMIASIMRSLSKDKLYTVLNDKYTEKILNADYRMFTDISCSKIITSTEQIWKIVYCGDIFTRIITMFVTIVVTLYNIYLVGGNIVIAIVIIYGVATCIFKYLFRQYDKLDKQIVDVRYRRNQELDECINGFAEVRSFCTQNHHKKSIGHMNHVIYNTRKKRGFVDMMINGCFNAVDGIGTVAMLSYAAENIARGVINVAQGYSLIMYLWRLIEPIAGMIDIVSELSDNLSMMEQFTNIVNYKNSNCDGHIELSEFSESIDLQDISFTYGNSSNDVLSNMSLKIHRGQKIGICGASGGGKSTLLKLLTKFYAPTEGCVMIDGIDTRMIKSDSIRSKMAIVHQDNHIFGGSIYDNIVYGNWSSTEHDVIEACKNANLYDFIQSLPDKFNTVVGPKGMKLSGGQKQRIALARVFLKDPDIVLLDEATSALDNECESIIQESLTKFGDKTVITVAHRLSTIKDSDVIYVVGNHTIQESGTHEQLLTKGGIYASMYKHY